jgi:hypothetical protein
VPRIEGLGGIQGKKRGHDEVAGVTLDVLNDGDLQNIIENAKRQLQYQIMKTLD